MPPLKQNLAEDKLTLSHDNSVEDKKKMNNVKQSLINLITVLLIYNWDILTINFIKKCKVCE